MWLRSQLLALLVAAAASAEPARNAVTAVRYWSLNDATRVVVEATEEFRYHTERVQNPERLFFDVFGARMRVGKKGFYSVAVNDGLLKQIRVAETLPGVTRVVFDLEPGVESTASQLSNPNRLIVELRSTNKLVSKLEAVPISELADKPSIAAVAAKAVTIPNPVRDNPIPSPPLEPPKRVPVQTARIEKARPPAESREKLAAALKPPSPARLSEFQSMTRVLGLKIGRIVLDAGHGGHDTGTIGAAGLSEKELVLDVTKRLGALIDARMGAEVIYTRSDDTFIPLESRTRIANDKKADLFLSIHANSSPEDSSSGVETYYLNFTTSKSAMEVAARENASSQKTVYELKDTLQKIALHDKVDESREFAGKLQQYLYAASAKANSRTRDRGVKKAPFVVLIGASMPSVLAEIGFVSNPKDEALFRKPEFRQKIAEGLYRGLAKYASSLSHFQIAAK